MDEKIGARHGAVDCSRTTVRREVHAYTLPRSTPNSRVKDLVDMALLIGDSTLDQHCRTIWAQYT